MSPSRRSTFAPVLAQVLASGSARACLTLTLLSSAIGCRGLGPMPYSDSATAPRSVARVRAIPASAPVSVEPLARSVATSVTPDEFDDAREDHWRGVISYVAGARDMGEDFPDAETFILPSGVDALFTPPSRSISWVAQGLFGYVSEGPDEAPGSNIEDVDFIQAKQLNLGLRKVWGHGRWRPFLGGGVSYLSMVFEDSSAFFGSTNRLDHDQSLGYWLGAGIYGHVGNTFTLGLSVQGTMGHELEMVGRTFDADGIDALLFLGTRF